MSRDEGEETPVAPPPADRLRATLRRLAVPGLLVTPADAEVLRAVGVPPAPHFGSARSKAIGEPSAWRVVAPEGGC